MRLTDTLRSDLQNLFDDRISFRPAERKLYGHDIGVIPKLVRPLIGKTIPDAVVQPSSEAEVAELVRWARAHHVPLTPRGKATSGYGGVIPLRHGVVVDTYRLSAILDVDTEALTATVEPGVVWETLDRALLREGLTLRLYPTSYPSSTVGGWLAQGGAGIGSFEAGWFRDNVVSARVVLPTGEVRDVHGGALDLVSDAEGITGIVTRVTIRVQPHSPLAVHAIAFPSPQTLQRFAELAIADRLPLWSMVFINPTMAKLEGMAPVREHDGRPTEERVILPEKYVALLAYREDDRATVAEHLDELVREAGGALLDRHLSEHMWTERFNIMRVKRLGPSLVPSEVVVPLTGLGATLRDLAHKLHQPLVMEGVVLRARAGHPAEVAILGFMPQDQRTFGYNLVSGLALSMIRIAERHGGRAYSTGMYFKHKTRRVLGRARTKRLAEYKRQVDPDRVMNPGKVFGSSVLVRFMRLAEQMEPVVRWFGNRIGTTLGDRATEPVRGIPADVAWYAYACAQCGFCISDCDQFYGRGWESQTARGKWYWLREYMEGREEMDQAVVDSFLACTTCELCDLRCGLALPIEPSWMKLRGKLVNDDHRMTFPPFEIMEAALTAEGDIWAGYRKDRARWFPDDLAAKHGPSHRSKHVYFAGCTASYCEQDIAIGSVRLLDEAGVDFTYLGERESCCATPMLIAGKWDTFADTMRQNIDAVREAGADTVITSCPACDLMWRTVYPAWANKLGMEYGITTRHYSEIVSEKIARGEFTFPDGSSGNGHQPVTVTWHDSCHIGRASGVYDPPRDLIKAIPGVSLVEMAHARENAHCCGSVLTLVDDPPVAAEIGKVRLDEALEAGAEKVLALCPCCEFQFRVTAEKKHVPVEIVDLARFAVEHLGYTLPDPDPLVRSMWAPFERMIPLLTPEGIADLMRTMFPEMVDAMPYGMGRMMRVLAYLPGGLAAMKPLFPRLFPRIFPKMLPALLPTFLDRVNASVPLPDYLAAQLPDYMPRVMENLMPHMLPDVVPLISDQLVEYLENTGSV